MFFEGFSLHLTEVPDNIEGHPFHVPQQRERCRDLVDRRLPGAAARPPARRCRSRYIRKVIDTVYDLPNVLYEVANESSGMDAESVEMPDGTVIDTPIGDTTQWQYWVVDTVKEYER